MLGVADEDTTRAGTKHDGPARTSPYPVSRLAPSYDLVDTAREIQRADTSIGASVNGKLEVIAHQIRSLQEQARTILGDARRDLDLHRAKCNFTKRVGALYHLYEKAPGQHYFSMLSVDDWGGSPPHAFVGTYRLEADLTWTPAERIDPDAPRAHDVVQRLLAAGDADPES